MTRSPEANRRGKRSRCSEEDCWFVRLLPDGTPVVRMDEMEREVEIDGLEIPRPVSSQYRSIFNKRLPRSGKPLRCEVRQISADGRVRGKFHCYGWHDKSGDVWLDLAIVLLDEGVVAVDRSRKFPEREEYLQHEAKARSANQVLDGKEQAMRKLR